MHQVRSLQHPQKQKGNKQQPKPLSEREEVRGSWFVLQPFKWNWDEVVEAGLKNGTAESSVADRRRPERLLTLEILYASCASEADAFCLHHFGESYAVASASPHAVSCDSSHESVPKPAIRVFGIDTETKPVRDKRQKNPVALLQLGGKSFADKHIDYAVLVYSMLDDAKYGQRKMRTQKTWLPVVVQNMLMDERSHFCGVEAKQDVQNLTTAFKLNEQLISKLNVWDLKEQDAQFELLSAVVGAPVDTSQRKLVNPTGKGLKAIATEVLRAQGHLPTPTAEESQCIQNKILERNQRELVDKDGKPRGKLAQKSLRKKIEDEENGFFSVPNDFEITMSNWSASVLSAEQIQYAALDAFYGAVVADHWIDSS